MEKKNFEKKLWLKKDFGEKKILEKNNFFGLDGFLVISVKFWTFWEKNDQKCLSKILKRYLRILKFLNFTIFNADFKSFYRFEIAYLVPKIFEFW